MEFNDVGRFRTVSVVANQSLQFSGFDTQTFGGNGGVPFTPAVQVAHTFAQAENTFNGKPKYLISESFQRANKLLSLCYNL